MPISRQFVVRSSIALLAIGFVALLFIVLTTMRLSQRAQIHLGEVTAAREMRISATLLRESLLMAESSQRGYLLTGNEIYLAPYDNAKTVARAELARLTLLMASQPSRKALLGQLGTVVDQKLIEQDSTIALRSSGHEAEAIGTVTSNRGKALMDEANVYLSAVALEYDERMNDAIAEQTSNIAWLRWASFASAIVIMAVVAGVLTTLSRFTLETMAARDEVRRANETLEARVEERTHALAGAKDRAEVLLAEVNHRVANSLALVSSLVRLQARDLKEPAAKAALEETNGRIAAIGQMHKLLFTTGNVGQVAADTYLAAVLSQLESVMAASGSKATLKHDLESVTLPTSDAVNMGIIVTEWVTNALKYAYPGETGGEVRVDLRTKDDAISLAVEDDGVGRGDARNIGGTGLGMRVVSAIAGIMQANISYHSREPGTRALLTMPANRASAAPAVVG